ncbi:hypothetical protein ACN6KF_002804 [Labrys sp. La1]|uniref:hypothetical protein n=1 Tax=Labrys sp. La1 TaxID=3404917 RepID=UPI003EC0767C
MVSTIAEYHNYIDKAVNDFDSNNRILFGIWCVYNNLSDKEMNSFIEKESEGEIYTNDIRKFLEKLWESIFISNSIDGPLIEDGINIKSILNNTVWIHDEIVSRNPENEHISWVCILTIGGMENFLDYILDGNVHNLLLCAENNLNISDYKAEFGLTSNKQALKDEIDTQVSFIDDLQAGAINLKEINKYSERFI